MKKFNLLVFIDDDHPTNVFHKIIVEESKLCDTCLFFNSPIDALEYFEELSRNDNSVYPDAIFLDINMPELTGWEFLQKYQQIDIKQSPVVIMLTTSLLSRDLEKANDIGIVYKLINKPLDTAHLRTLNQELLEISIP